MNGVIVTMYPRQFTSLHSGPTGVIQSKGDVAVGLLYEMMVDRRYTHKRWAFEAHVLDTAMRLFGDFSIWVAAQRANPSMIGQNLAFIEDTLKFIEGEPRELCIENWIELVSQGQGDIHLADLRIPPVQPRLRQSPSTVKALQKWCSRPQGLEDLLSTLHLLFGQARP